MSSSNTGQKFIARNRAPRVQIEYDVEIGGAQEKKEIPFVMGVMGDLSGIAEKPGFENRDFLEFDADNFDDRMKSIAPEVRLSVPNKLTGEGNLSIEMTFNSMEDFSPAAVAENVAPLNELLQARNQLKNLITYMDGKVGAEELIEKVLSNPGLIESLVATANADEKQADEQKDEQKKDE